MLMLTVRFLFPVPLDCVTPNKSNTFLLKCPSRSHFGIVFTRSQEFEEEVALTSARTQELANDAANHEDLDRMRSAMARLGSTQLQLLFPSMTSFTPAKKERKRKTNEKALSPKREKKLRSKGKERRIKQKEILSEGDSEVVEIASREEKPLAVVNGAADEVDILLEKKESANELFEEELDIISSESSSSEDTNPDDLPEGDYADSDEAESDSCSSENHSS
jgi:hypothetical protein